MPQGGDTGPLLQVAGRQAFGITFLLKEQTSKSPVELSELVAYHSN